MDTDAGDDDRRGSRSYDDDRSNRVPESDSQGDRSSFHKQPSSRTLSSTSAGGFEIKGAASEPGRKDTLAASLKNGVFPSVRGRGHASIFDQPPQAPLRRTSTTASGSGTSTPAGPAKDPHTLEREARDRERLLKEAQRMASRGAAAMLSESAGGRKRSSREMLRDAGGSGGGQNDGGGGGGGSSKRRRRGGRGGDARAEDDAGDAEARTGRLERERERGRR